MDKRRSVLKCDNISISFGGLKAVNGFNLDVKEKDLIGLIGPNGAGKTTAFNMLSGVYEPTEGAIYLDGENITGLPVHKLSQKGIARTFQNIRLFDYLSVVDNVKVSMNRDMRYKIVDGMLRLKNYWKEEREATKKALDILKILGLAAYANDMKLVLGICEKLYVLNHGIVIAKGKPEEVVKKDDVVSAYLGSGYGE